MSVMSSAIGGEWIKDAVQSCWIDSRSGILHCDDNCVGAVTLRYHPKHPTSISRVLHRFDRIVDQVNDDLSQLVPMAIDTLQFGRKRGFDRNAVVRQLFAHRLQYVEYDFVDDSRFSFLINSAERSVEQPNPGPRRRPI
jgi:hypothetical protein